MMGTTIDLKQDSGGRNGQEWEIKKNIKEAGLIGLVGHLHVEIHGREVLKMSLSWLQNSGW